MRPEPSDLNWNDLQVFTAVARAGHFLGASITLGIDRTTISRRLTALEQRLGAQLFSRTRTGVRLTAAGSRTLVQALKMEEASAAISSERTKHHEVSGIVRVALTEALAPFVIEAGLMSVRDDYPTLQLELVAGSRRVDLAAGDADLALRLDPLTGATLRARCLNRSGVSLYATAAYVQQRGAPRSPSQLEGHEVLVPAGELSVLPEAQWLSRQRGVRVALTSNSLPALVAAARAGKGLVALTDLWGAREPSLQRLFAVPGLPTRALWLVTTATGAKRPAIIAVTQRIVQLFGRS